MMKRIGLDTETIGKDLWSVQVCTSPGVVDMYLVQDNPKNLGIVKSIVEDEDTLTIVHNALFDIRLLKQNGIMPSHFTDTMSMAYLLGEGSIGLKVLAYRYSGMHMRRYTDVVWKATKEKVSRWVQEIVNREWADPDPVVEWKSGRQHVRFPHNIKKKVERLYKKYLVDPNVDMREALLTMEGIEQVFPVLGEIPIGYLSEIPIDEARDYACADADATNRIYDPLFSRVQEIGLEETLDRDMGCVEMLIDMMDNGVYLDKSMFRITQEELEDELDTIQSDITHSVGHYINPSSPPQVLALLRKRGHKVKDTSSDTLSKITDDFIVTMIKKYREIHKLLSTYAVKMPSMVGEDGRIHTKFSLTTAATGRLASSDPNLQNIPVRTENGNKIRRGLTVQPRT